MYSYKILVIYRWCSITPHIVVLVAMFAKRRCYSFIRYNIKLKGKLVHVFFCTLSQSYVRDLTKFNCRILHVSCATSIFFTYCMSFVEGSLRAKFDCMRLLQCYAHYKVLYIIEICDIYSVLPSYFPDIFHTKNENENHQI